MIGATAKAEQFHSRSGSEATKGSRKGYSILGGGEDVCAHLTAEEQRDSIKRRLAVLIDMRKTGNLMQSVRLEIHELQNQLHALRPALKSVRPKEIPSLFMEICRERMTKLEFQRVMDEANNRQRAAIARDGTA